MSKNKYPKLLALLLITILAAAAVACARKNEDVKGDNNQQTVPEETTEESLTAVNALLAQDYLQKNISELSPKKEVLGGKFYITNLKFIDHNNAEVDYEDGHIALKAKINFVIEPESGGGKTVKVNSFEIIGE